MNIIKFTAICCLSTLIVINVAMLQLASAADKSKIGYGRGGRMSGSSKS